MAAYSRSRSVGPVRRKMSGMSASKRASPTWRPTASRDPTDPTSSETETIVYLQGRFSYSGKPLARAFLLKHAGMNKSFKAIMRSEQFGYALEDSKEKLVEEKAAVEWESRVAFALASHEFGLVFEALAEGMRSKNASFFSACLVSATWLVHMLCSSRHGDTRSCKALLAKAIHIHPQVLKQFGR
ncbi:putative E3 ubiquitin-protein ligase LIN-1 isoform X2 [Iris pallida]|uniref:E3 ubiquitin-protein ligase LIN-1 isoform X2 n=1 Tax=Iris pallida TaxID=29817 RepID=A0AAX6G849_IRIPA|nr:putative E3 ubiquitin-protein ligase LIN-1 isoform X2 [Iris pallida]